MVNKYNIVLGSKSPRRSQLLAESGFEFVIRTEDTNEDYPDDLHINEIAEYLAIKKANALKAGLDKNELLITADSVVIQNNILYGKPENFEHAKQIIKDLSGHTHKVVTGVCITTLEEQKSFSETTLVTFAEFTNEEIEHYITNFEPYDKAGAYGIQDWLGLNKVTKIEGSYTNVMGLPTHRLYHVLAEMKKNE